jgi:hypothetical protein
MATDTGGPAYPVPEHKGITRGHPGMTLRDRIALQVIGGMVADPTVRDIKTNADDLAATAYVLADAMIRARKA